jgi:hemerythrin
MLEWTTALSVGDAEIDEQHQELFRRAGRLLEGLRSGQPEELGELIDYLHQYCITHFGAEEARMRASRYPGYLRHKSEHDRFISDLLALAAEHDERGSGAFISLKVNHWLVEWLKSHVAGTDSELGRFLARRSA